MSPPPPPSGTLFAGTEVRHYHADCRFDDVCGVSVLPEIRDVIIRGILNRSCFVEHEEGLSRLSLSRRVVDLFCRFRR